MTRRPIDAHVRTRADDAGEEPDEDAVRDAFARWASGVAVMAARDDDGGVYALTIAALCPVSVEPPLILACIHNDAPLASVLVEGLACSVSILSEGQKRAATTFADRFAVAGDLLADDDGVPVIAASAGVLIGRVETVHDGGDHRIVVVRVTRVSGSRDALPPLLYWQRAYRRLEAES